MNTNPKNTVHTTITIDNGQLDQMQKIREERCIPISTQIRLALRLWLPTQK